MKPLKRHTAFAHAAYADLVRNLKDEAVSDLRGTPVRKEKGGLGFWYDTYRIGTEVKTQYIGPDTDELRAQLSRHRELAQDRQARRRERQRLIRVLRAEGFLGLDAGTGSLLTALEGVGTFRLGGTIIGTHAFRLYEGELGVHMRFDQMAMTGDIDIASFERLSLALEEKTSPGLASVLKDLKFQAVPSLKPNEVWRWQQASGETLIEFLTPSFSKDEDVRELPSFGVNALSLHFLNYLIADPIAAALTYRHGILVQIPRPERFAIHKLIVANRRRRGPDAAKSMKDLKQAEFLLEVLMEDRPGDVVDAYRDAYAMGPKWRDHIQASLERLPEIKRYIENIR